MGAGDSSWLMMTNDRKKIRVGKLSDQGKEDDLRDLTPEERLGIMWQLAQDAWAMKGEGIAERRLPRHVVRVVRGKS